MPIALLRAGPSVKVVVISESAAGTVNAAATPFRKRAAISSEPSLTSPPISDASVKTDSATIRTRLRPSRSDARPPSSSTPPNPST